jgi:hypothetical protein
MRLVADLKMGYYPLPVEHGPNFRARLSFPGKGKDSAAALDPCAGTGAALHAITKDSGSLLYGVELDAMRAAASAASGIQTIQGNVMDVRSRVERLSLLYLNPPYAHELSGVDRSKRMEQIFLTHTYSWLKPKGVVVMVIPGKAIDTVTSTLASRFRDVRIYRMDGEDAIKYDQYAIFGVRRDNYGSEGEAIRREIVHMNRNRAHLPLLSDEPDVVYDVTAGGDVQLSYIGIPFDDVEDRLIDSGAWKYTAPMLLPKLEIVGGRPLTPLHGGHVAIVATAGMINGVFGEGEEKHIARWRPVKHTSTITEKDGDATIVRTKERFSNELSLVYVCGSTLVLTENNRNEAPPKDDGVSLVDDSIRSLESDVTGNKSRSVDDEDGYDDEDAEVEEEPVEVNSDPMSRFAVIEADDEDDDAEEFDYTPEPKKAEVASNPSAGATLLRGRNAVLPNAKPDHEESKSISFPMGRLMMTRGVQEVVASGFNLARLVGRHEKGDWGDELSPFDLKQNNIAVAKGDLRILSSYSVPEAHGGKIWIITEADRSATTVLLPEEY